MMMKKRKNNPACYSSKFKRPAGMNTTIINIKKTSITALLLLFISMISNGETMAQQQQPSAEYPYFRSVNIYGGFFNPSFSYFDRTFWDFSGGANFGVETEFDFNPYFGIRGSIGFFGTSSDVQRMAGNTETLRYQFVPISFSPYVKYEPENITLFLKTGVDLIPISGSYIADFRTQSVSGSTTTFHVEGAVEHVFNEIALSLYVKYLIGSFDQEITFIEGTSPTTENIELNGFSFGFAFKYLF